ncbi:hypothetical protein BH20ACI2_BH20ACI2_14250 [soil metagenome]
MGVLKWQFSRFFKGSKVFRLALKLSTFHPHVMNSNLKLKGYISFIKFRITSTKMQKLGSDLQYCNIIL